MKISVAIFDLDGTLIDSANLILSSLNFTFLKMGVLSNGNISGKAPGFHSKTCKLHLGKGDKELIIQLFDEYIK